MINMIFCRIFYILSHELFMIIIIDIIIIVIIIISLLFYQN